MTSQLSVRSENYWNERSESLKGISGRSNAKKQGRRLSNGYANGSYKPRSKLPQLNSPRQGVVSPTRGGRYTVVPPLSGTRRIKPGQRLERSTWTRPPLESPNEGRIPQPQVPSNLPRVVDNANYRNYLKKRYPRIAAIEDEVRGITPELIGEPTPMPVRNRPRMNVPAPAAPPPIESPRNETLAMYTYFCEYSSFAVQYTEDLIIRFLDEEIINDVIIDSIHESVSEKMYVSTTDLYTYWIENTLFAEEFVETFIERVISDEMIPNLLIDTISLAHTPARQVSDSTAIEIYHDLLRDVVPQTVREMSATVVRERNASQYVIQHAHYCEVLASSLLNEVVVISSRNVVREVVIELANEERLNAIYYDMMQLVFIDFMKEEGPKLVTEACYDAAVEIFFEKEVLNEVLYSDIEAVAVEVLTYYDTQLRRKDLEEIMKLGREKPVATIALDHCLSLISNQAAVRSSNSVLNKNLEGISLDAILDRFDDIMTDFNFTSESNAMKRFHEKATLDVAVAVLGNELIKHCDEDLADLDFEEVDKTYVPRYVKDIDSIFYGSTRDSNDFR